MTNNYNVISMQSDMYNTHLNSMLIVATEFFSIPEI